MRRTVINLYRLLELLLKHWGWEGNKAHQITIANQTGLWIKRITYKIQCFGKKKSEKLRNFGGEKRKVIPNEYSTIQIPLGLFPWVFERLDSARPNS